VLIEAEAAAGYHSTGRSAAIWILNYGPPDARVLTGLSRPFFETPPPGFADAPLMSRRPVVFLAPEDQEPQFRRMLEEGHGLSVITLDEARRLIPGLKPDYAVAAAIERDAFDMDVAALHQGFLRQLRTRGGQLALRSRAERIECGRDRRHGIQRAGRSQRGGRLGRRGRREGLGRPARADAEAADRGHCRCRLMAVGALADDPRCRPDLVCPAGGTYQADGVPRR
jgi:glycine/D-amino acid oxidase-like deaminating enzyme